MTATRFQHNNTEHISRGPVLYGVQAQSWAGGFLGRLSTSSDAADVGIMALNAAQAYAESPSLRQHRGGLKVVNCNAYDVASGRHMVLSYYSWSVSEQRWVHGTGRRITALDDAFATVAA